MLIPFRKIFFIIAFNMSLFLLLMIGIQNSENRKQINLIATETVKLPISFIIGLSFITGSITGSTLTLNFRNKKF